MGSVEAELEVDMEISDDEQEKRAVPGQVVEDGRLSKQSSAAESMLATNKAGSSRKRKRFSPEESGPSVRVEYHELSRESRRKLQDLMREWSLWQGYYSRQSSEARDDYVESGEEQYYPALQVGSLGSSFSVTFWVDKPAKQGRRNESGDSREIARTSTQDFRESEADVPLYDRVTPSLSTPESRKDGFVELEREAVRCFNCGSYSHGLRDCRRQLNYDAINSARSNHASKRAFTSGPRSASRYYETNRSNEEPDRAPLQTSSFGHPLSNSGKESTRSFSSSEKKDEKNNSKLPCTEDNEEGEIVDGVGSTCSEEELYIAFSPEPALEADRTTHDNAGPRASYNSVSERMWRSPPPAFSPPIQMHPNFHHQRSFAYPPQNPVYSHTPSPVRHQSGMNPQRSWSDERHHPQRPWDGRNLYYSENNSSPAQVNVSSAPIAVPAAKKEDDDWELNFESSVYQSSENSRSTFLGVPGAAAEHPRSTYLGVPGAAAEQPRSTFLGVPGAAAEQPRSTFLGVPGAAAEQPRSTYLGVPGAAAEQPRSTFLGVSGAAAEQPRSTYLGVPGAAAEQPRSTYIGVPGAAAEQSKSTFLGVPGAGAEQPYTPASVRSYPALTVNTVSGFSPPDPSQLSPTGSGYGDSFRPSPAPQTSVQYQISYLSPQVRESSYSAEAWDKAQAALSSLQKRDEKGVPG